MRMLIVGAGGAGAYFAARWAAAGRNVTLLARGSQLAAIRANGVTIHAPAGTATAKVDVTDSPAAAAKADAVLFAVKTWQLADAVAPIVPHLGRDAIVFGVLNGVDCADQLAATFGRGRTLGGALRIISYVESPGVIRHVGVDPTIVVGELDGGVSPRVQRLHDTFTLEPAVKIEASPNILLDVWRKFLFFAPVSGVGSVTRSTIGAYRAHPASRAMLRAAIAEVFALGRARGIPFADTAVDDALAFIDRSPPDGTTSTHRDFEAGRRTEIEALSGAVSRMGRESGVPTPTHDFLYAALAPQEARARAVPAVRTAQ